MFFSSGIRHSLETYLIGMTFWLSQTFVKTWTLGIILAGMILESEVLDDMLDSLIAILAFRLDHNNTMFLLNVKDRQHSSSF